MRRAGHLYVYVCGACRWPWPRWLFASLVVWMPAVGWVAAPICFHRLPIPRAESGVKRKRGTNEKRMGQGKGKTEVCVCMCVCVFLCVKGRGSRGLLAVVWERHSWEMRNATPFSIPLPYTHISSTHTHGHTIPISLSSPQERRFGGAGAEGGGGGGGGEVKGGEGRGMEKGTDRGIKIHGSFFFYFPCWKSIVFTMNEWNSGQQWCRGDTERERERETERGEDGEKEEEGWLYCDRQKHQRPRLKTIQGRETERDSSAK